MRIQRNRVLAIASALVKRRITGWESQDMYDPCIKPFSSDRRPLSQSGQPAVSPRRGVKKTNFAVMLDPERFTDIVEGLSL